MSQIIKGHNKKIVQKETQQTLKCNCSVKTECPRNDDCRKVQLVRGSYPPHPPFLDHPFPQIF